MSKKLLLPTLLALALAACSSTTSEKPAPVETKPAPSTTETKPAPAPEAKAVDPLAAVKDPSNILSKRSVFFDFDKFDVKSDYQALVQAHGKFLAANPTVKILIQGNTDERGSREYNLALGQKRADAVKKSLGLSGATEAQIESVSLGEEKPRATGSSEEAYTENRRADILYQGEY
ncbi:peptidoglycan-associated lipoprotein Pal [Niveibacterium sp. SC-1]|uniref:peptidoglycan-associated lipoprotein Pal n=1 Tax=Niveibacterium sp. SC-1 TaxID=3135646 RepID=UPI00311F21A3